MNTNLLLPERFRTYDSFNRMMEDFFGAPTNKNIWSPAVDVKETDVELLFTVELPGINLEDVNVEVKDDVLTISGKREFNQEEKKDDFVRVERSYGTFKRMFGLGGPVKAEEVKAAFKDGLLTVAVPRVKAIEPKRVPVAKG